MLFNDASTVDSDGDGVGDNADAFPNDASETRDTDGEPAAMVCPLRSTTWNGPIHDFTDQDGVNDGQDAFPLNPKRW